MTKFIEKAIFRLLKVNKAGNFLFNLEHKMFLYMQPFSGMRISCIKIFKNLVGIGKVVHVY